MPARPAAGAELWVCSRGSPLLLGQCLGVGLAAQLGTVRGRPVGTPVGVAGDAAGQQLQAAPQHGTERRAGKRLVGPRPLALGLDEVGGKFRAMTQLEQLFE